MAAYLPKGREQSTSHLQVSSDSRNLCAVSRTNSSAMETSVWGQEHIWPTEGNSCWWGKKLHGDLCGEELPTVLSHKTKPLLDAPRTPPKPTVCKKRQFKIKTCLKIKKARSKKNARVWSIMARFCFVFIEFFPKYNSQSIFETDFVVPVGEKYQCLSSSRFSRAKNIMSPLF